MSSKAVSSTKAATESPMYEYSPETKSVKILYDGFLTGSVMKRCTPSLMSVPNAITSCDGGSTTTVLNTFSLMYPGLSEKLQQLIICDAVIVRPTQETPTGKFGATYRIGIPFSVLDPFIEVARRNNYNMTYSIVKGDGYYWLNSTIDNKTPDLMYMLRAEVKSGTATSYYKVVLKSPYSELHHLKVGDVHHNTIGFTTVDIKIKTSITEESIQPGDSSIRQNYIWDISTKLYSFIVKDTTLIGPKSSSEQENTVDYRMVASDRLMQSLNFDAELDAENEAD